MPGSIVFRPIEANLTHNTELIGKMDPYVQFILGTHKVRTNVCRKGGKHPMWEESITLPASTEFPTCLVEIKDKDLLKDDRIGSFEIDLREIESQGNIKRWFPIFHRDKPAGEILMEARFSGDQGLGGYGTQGLQSNIAPTMLSGGMMGTSLPQPTLLQSSFPLQTPGVIPTHGSKSLSEQYAEEALLRGIDPLHSHSADLINQQPLPTSFSTLGYQDPSLNPGQVLNKDLPVNKDFTGAGGFVNQGFLPNQGLLPNQGGLIQAGLPTGATVGGTNLSNQMGVPLGVSYNNASLNPLKRQIPTPIQHGQEVPVGTGIGSDYLTNNVTVSSNMGTTGHHVHPLGQQHVFGHGHHHEHGEVVKEGLNPTTWGPKTNPGQETFDRTTGKW